MNLAIWLERTAQVMGARPALLVGQTVVARLRHLRAPRGGACARALRTKGSAPGDRVGIFAKNVPDYLTCFYAIWHAGAAAVPINAKLHPKEAAWILSDAEARTLFRDRCPGEGLARFLICRSANRR
jgi:long-chain acyl-CoA synthetase